MKICNIFFCFLAVSEIFVSMPNCLKTFSFTEKSKLREVYLELLIFSILLTVSTVPVQDLEVFSLLKEQDLGILLFM